MEGLHNAVKSGKARYIGISNCFAWQLAKANFYAREHGLTEFVSIQGHYNLIAREEEREMAPFCADQNIAMTPYSALAGGRLSRRPGETSRRDSRGGRSSHRPRGKTGRQARRHHDGNFSRVAAHESDLARCRGDKVFPCGRRGKGG